MLIHYQNLLGKFYHQNFLFIIFFLFLRTQAFYNKTLFQKDGNYSIAFDTDKNESILLIRQVNKSEHENEYICRTINEFGSADMRHKINCSYFIEQLKK